MRRLADRQADRQTDKQTERQTEEQLERGKLQLLPVCICVCVCLWPLGSCNMRQHFERPFMAFYISQFAICLQHHPPSPPRAFPLLLLAANASHCRILTVPGIKLPASVARMARHVGSRRTISIRMLRRVSMRHVPQVS